MGKGIEMSLRILCSSTTYSIYMRVKFALILTCMFASCLQLSAQNVHSGSHEEETAYEEEREQHHHQLQFALAHTHISNGRTTDDQKKWLALASWALNYNYLINEKWQVGLHTDVILEEFRVAHGSDEVILERSSPVAIAGMAGYKFWGPLMGLVGGGVEFASEGNLSFARLGIESGWHFGSGKWEMSLIGTYEFKFEAYNSWLFGLGISRLF